VPAVPGQHYSLKGSSGIEGDAVPPAPDVNPEIWQANTEQEPHLGGNDGKNVTWYPVDPATAGLHYTSQQGNRNWFYFRAPVPAQPEVTEQATVVDQEAWTETVEHPAVVCPTEPPTTQPPTTQPPTAQPPTTQPPTAQPPEVLPTTAPPSAEPAGEVTQQPTASPDDAEVLGVQASQPPAPSAQVPTVVDAGLAASPDAGTSTAQQWGVVLAAMGMVLLAASGGVLVRTRKA